MASRDDVLIQENAITRADLEIFSAYVQQARKSASLVSNFDDALASEWVVDRSIRDTQEVYLTDEMRQRITRLTATNIAAVIDPFYQVEVRDQEPAQILRYGVGGHYIPHVDAETLYSDDDGVKMWEKTLDRDLSLVYFLNDDFTGGELIFPDLDLVIEPVSGTLVCFPSDHHFIHGVKPVIGGERYTLVTWMRVQGMPSPDEINAQAMADYERIRPQQPEQPSRIARSRGIRSRSG